MAGNLIFSVIALLIVTADQLAKLWINSILEPGQVFWEYGFLRIVLVYNTGAAFGLFQDWTGLLTVLRCIGLVIILVIVILFNRRIINWGGKWIMLSLGLIFGGTAGNLVDIFRIGHVVDFIDLTYWPVFNLADSSVVVAMFILGFLILRDFLREKKKHGLSGNN